MEECDSAKRGSSPVKFHYTMRLCLRKGTLQSSATHLRGVTWQGEDPLQVKIALQGVVGASKSSLQRRVIHLKSVTLQREGPVLGKIATKGGVASAKVAMQRAAIYSRLVTLQTEEYFMGKITPQGEVSLRRKVIQQRWVTQLKGKTWLQEDTQYMLLFSKTFPTI